MSRTRRRRRPEDHPRVRHLFEQARASERGTPPRRHHLVPRSYLARWSENGFIRRTDTDSKASYTRSPRACEYELDYYRFESPDLPTPEVPPTLFETLLSNVENDANHVMNDLRTMSFNEIGAYRMFMFAWFLSFQATRGRAFRAGYEAMVADISRLRFSGTTAERLLSARGMETPDDPDIEAVRDFLTRLDDGSIVMRPQVAEMVGRAALLAKEVWEHLIRERNWVVYETAPILITCDEPIVRIGGPGTTRAERPGLAGAGVLAFPLSPSQLLIMGKPGLNIDPPHVLDRAETLDINREILANSERFSYEEPGRHVTEKMQVPPQSPPYQREGPLDVEGQPEAELYRMYHPSRWWKDTNPPPWPVPRWWTAF